MSFVYKNVAKLSLDLGRKSARQQFAPLVARHLSSSQQSYKASDVVRKELLAKFSEMFSFLSFLRVCSVNLCFLLLPN